MDTKLFDIPLGDAEGFAVRSNEAHLAVLIPAAAYLIALTDHSEKPKLLDMLCAMLVRWEDLTGSPHEVDGIYNEIAFSSGSLS